MRIAHLPGSPVAEIEAAIPARHVSIRGGIVAASQALRREAASVAITTDAGGLAAARLAGVPAIHLSHDAGALASACARVVIARTRAEAKRLRARIEHVAFVPLPVDPIPRTPHEGLVVGAIGDASAVRQAFERTALARTRFVTSSELSPEFFAELDLFVHDAAFPAALPMAMAAGAAIIGFTGDEDARHLLGGAFAPGMIPPNDGDSLAWTIADFAARPELRSFLSDTGRRRALREHASSAVSAAWRAAFAQLFRFTRVAEPLLAESGAALA